MVDVLIHQFIKMDFLDDTLLILWNKKDLLMNLINVDSSFLKVLESGKLSSENSTWTRWWIEMSSV